jgi:hypothetical protein
VLAMKASVIKTLKAVQVLLVLSIVFVIYANQVDDLDFWWHLKHGKLLYETGSIPQKDPFAYTTEIPDDIDRLGKTETRSILPSEKNKRFWLIGLSTSWLSQIIFYLVYLLSGFKGIGILKSGVFVLAYLILYLAMRRRGAGHLSSFLVLCLVAVIGADFNYTRAQIFTFLMFPCVLYVLYDFRSGGKLLYFLPALMLLWANLHGGFILGVLVIPVFTFGELLKFLLKDKIGLLKSSSLDKKRIKKLVFVSIASVAVSMINPNGYDPVLFPLIQQKSVFAFIEEYHKPMLYEYHEYWFMLALTVAATIISALIRRMDLTELLIAFSLILPSLQGVRYIMIFALGAAIFLAHSMTAISSRVKDLNMLKRFVVNERFQNSLKAATAFIPALAAVGVFASSFASGEVLKFDMREKRYPGGAVDFILKNKVQGNLFNTYSWGGYLIWRLSPEYKVFVDGRCLNETAFFHYNQIMAAAAGRDQAKPLWKTLADAYKIDFLLTPAVEPPGNIPPLINRLFAEDEWRLVYADGKSMIFLRDSPANQELIRRYSLPKESIIDEIIRECEHGIEETPNAWGFYETLGYMYMKKDRNQDAMAMFGKYLSMNPYNKTVRYNYELLRNYPGTVTN